MRRRRSAAAGGALLALLSVAPPPPRAAGAERGGAADASGTPAAAGAVPLATDDALLQDRLQRAYRRIPELREVQASVEAGVVHLTGASQTASGRDFAGELAARHEGVLHVVNDVAVPSEVGRRLVPLLARVRRMGDGLLQTLPLLLLGLLLLAVAWRVSRALRGPRVPLSATAQADLSRSLLRQVLATLVQVAALLLALDLLGFTAAAGALLGTAGVVGIAVGWALRDIVENYVAGILLGMRHPFAASDHIVIEGHEGKVVRLTLRETILMTLDGNHLRIPNAMVFKGVMLNYTRNPLRRLEFTAGIGTTEELARVQRIGLEALAAVPGVIREPPPSARIEELAASSVSVRFLAWHDQRQSDHYKVKSEAIRQVKAALDAAGVDLPVPTYEVLTQPLAARAREAEAAAAAAAPAEPAHAVGVDRHLEQQIAQDRARDGDEDLLEAKDAAPPR